MLIHLGVVLERTWNGGKAFKETAIEALLVSLGLKSLGIAKPGLSYNSIWTVFLLSCRNSKFFFFF